MTTLVRELFASPPSAPVAEIKVSGWVRTMRESKSFAFVELNDGSHFKNLQIVLEENSIPDYRELTRKISVGAAVEAVGTLVPTPGMQQPFELKAEHVTVLGESPSDYPLQKKRHSLEYLRTIQHLRPRANLFQCAFRVRSVAAQAIHSFFHDRGFVYVHTPILTGSDCEGAGEMFRVTTLDAADPPRLPDGAVDFDKDFFAKPVSLTVSGQLNCECLALAFRNVYTFGPTFRAENSYTPRHAAEFWMIEPEIAFADLAADATLAEDFLKAIFRDLLEERADDLAFFRDRVDKGCIDRLEKLVASEFARMTYTETIAHLERATVPFEFPVFWGCDLQAEHERYLTEQVVGRPVAVLEYPKEIKAFYMRLSDDERTVAAMDVLAPGIGEIIGGSQREERLEVLDRRLDLLGLKRDDYWWYRDLRRYGTVPHAGFGLGFERAIMYATGIDNIRDVIPFPRAPKQADF